MLVAIWINRQGVNVADHLIDFSAASQTLPGALEFYLVSLGGGFDPFPRGAALRLGNTLYLIEARGCVAHMGGIFQGFFALLGKRELGRGSRSRAASFSFAITPSVRIYWTPLPPPPLPLPPPPPLQKPKRYPLDSVDVCRGVGEFLALFERRVSKGLPILQRASTANW